MIRQFLLANRVSYSARLPITIQDVTKSIEGVTFNRFVFLNIYKNRILRLMKKEKTESSYNELVVHFTLNINNLDDELINNAIKNLLRKEDLVVIINRNPTLKIESLIAMKVNGVTNDMVLKVPPIVLPSLAGDIDGDVIAIIPVFSKQAKEEALNYLSISRIIRDKYSTDTITKDVLSYQDHHYGIHLLEQEFKNGKTN